MAINNDEAFDIDDNGITLRNNEGDVVMYLTSGSGSPVGSQAPVNTWFFRQDTQIFYKKFASGINDWRPYDGTDLPFSDPEFTSTNINDALIEAGVTAVQEAIDVPRSPLLLTHNGTLSNGQLVGYSNLANISPIIPFRGEIKEFSFANDRNSVEADFRFYRNTETAPNLFYTWEVRTGAGVSTDFVTDDNFTSPTFERGDTLIIRFDDRGTNPSDATLGIFWKVLQNV